MVVNAQYGVPTSAEQLFHLTQTSSSTIAPPLSTSALFSPLSFPLPITIPSFLSTRLRSTAAAATTTSTYASRARSSIISHDRTAYYEAEFSFDEMIRTQAPLSQPITYEFLFDLLDYLHLLPHIPGFNLHHNKSSIELHIPHRPTREGILLQGLNIRNHNVKFVPLVQANIIKVFHVPLQYDGPLIKDTIEAYGFEVISSTQISLTKRGITIQTGEHHYTVRKGKTWRHLPTVLQLFGRRWVGFRYPDQPESEPPRRTTPPMQRNQSTAQSMFTPIPPNDGTPDDSDPWFKAGADGKHRTRQSNRNQGSEFSSNSTSVGLRGTSLSAGQNNFKTQFDALQLNVDTDRTLLQHGMDTIAYDILQEQKKICSTSSREDFISHFHTITTSTLPAYARDQFTTVTQSPPLPLMSITPSSAHSLPSPPAPSHPPTSTTTTPIATVTSLTDLHPSHLGNPVVTADIAPTTCNTDIIQANLIHTENTSASAHHLDTIPPPSESLADLLAKFDSPSAEEDLSQPIVNIHVAPSLPQAPALEPDPDPLVISTDSDASPMAEVNVDPLDIPPDPDPPIVLDRDDSSLTSSEDGDGGLQDAFTSSRNTTSTSPTLFPSKRNAQQGFTTDEDRPSSKKMTQPSDLRRRQIRLGRFCEEIYETELISIMRKLHGTNAPVTLREIFLYVFTHVADFHEIHNVRNLKTHQQDGLLAAALYNLAGDYDSVDKTEVPTHLLDDHAVRRAWKAPIWKHGLPDKQTAYTDSLLYDFNLERAKH